MKSDVRPSCVNALQCAPLPHDLTHANEPAIASAVRPLRRKRYAGDVVQKCDAEKTVGKNDATYAARVTRPPPMAIRRWIRMSDSAVWPASTKTPTHPPAKTSAVHGKKTKLLRPGTGTM